MVQDTESGAPPKVDVASWLMTLVTVAMLLLISGAFAVMIPKFEMIYKDMGVVLPQLTESFIALHRSFLWTVLIVVAVANVIKEVRWNGYPGIAAFNVIGFFIVFTLALAMVIGLFIPILGIIENLSAHSPP